MVVMVLESVPRGLRGELSRWLIEVQAGVFVGHTSALVRDLLWDKCIEKSRAGRCCQIYSSDNEQHFRMRSEGEKERAVVEMQGLQLVAVRGAEWERWLKGNEGDFGGVEGE